MKYLLILFILFLNINSSEILNKESKSKADDESNKYTSIAFYFDNSKQSNEFHKLIKNINFLKNAKQTVLMYKFVRIFNFEKPFTKKEALEQLTQVEGKYKNIEFNGRQCTFKIREIKRLNQQSII